MKMVLLNWKTPIKRFKDWWKDSQTGKAPNRKDMKISLENNGYQYHRENHWDDEYIGK